MIPREPTQGTAAPCPIHPMRTQPCGICCGTIDAAPKPEAAAQDQIGEQGHGASVHCSLEALPLESGDAREATCLTAGHPGRGRTATQQGQLGANAGSIPASPTNTPAPAAPAPDARMSTHWETCGTDGGPRHWECAQRVISAQAEQIAELTRERDARESELYRKLKQIIDLTKAAKRAEAERDKLLAVVKAADELLVRADWPSARRAYMNARAKVSL